MNKSNREPGNDGDGAKDKNRKLYLARLADAGVSLHPVKSTAKPARQFQLAHLAAVMAKDADARHSPCDLVCKALQVWNSAGTAVHVEAQAQALVTGLLYFNRRDWEDHCRALVASLDHLDGAQPGQSPAELVCRCHETAKIQAAAAVNRLWRSGPPKDHVLRALFPGKAETDEERQREFMGLLEYAKETVAIGDSLPLGTKDADAVSTALLHAWEPLGVWDRKSFNQAVTQAKGLIGKRHRAALASFVPFHPCVARWIAVLRQDQLAAAKNRA